MKTVGSLILLIIFALIALVGVMATGDMIGEASGSNDTDIVSGSSGASAAASPIFIIMGFGVLIIGIMIAVNAFN